MAEETIVKLRVWPKIIIIMILIIGGLMIYIHFGEPHLLTYHEYEIKDNLIPESFNGFKVIHLSDIHFGRTTNETEIKNLITKITLTKPDLILFSGDLFDSYITLSEDNINFLITELKSLNAPFGKYAIIGDSDYLDIENYKKIMNEASFTILEGKNIPIYDNGNTPIYLSGLSSITKNTPSYDHLFTKEEQNANYQILLAHEPIIFQNVADKANLVLAGHSLGGLVHIPLTNKGLLTKNNVGSYYFGKYQKENSILYVSNGIGTEDYSIRFLNIPSFNLYRFYHN